MPQNCTSIAYWYKNIFKIVSTSSISLFGSAVAKVLDIWIHIWWMLCHYEMYFRSIAMNPKFMLLDKLCVNIVVMLTSLTFTAFEIFLYWYDTLWICWFRDTASMGLSPPQKVLNHIFFSHEYNWTHLFSMKTKVKKSCFNVNVVCRTHN